MSATSVMYNITNGGPNFGQCSTSKKASVNAHPFLYQPERRVDSTSKK